MTHLHHARHFRVSKVFCFFDAEQKVLLLIEAGA